MTFFKEIFSQEYNSSISLLSEKTFICMKIVHIPDVQMKNSIKKFPLCVFFNSFFFVNIIKIKWKLWMLSWGRKEHKRQRLKIFIFYKAVVIPRRRQQQAWNMENHLWWKLWIFIIWIFLMMHLLHEECTCDILFLSFS